MVDEHPDVQITLDKEDPNISRSEIMLKGPHNSKKLLRKSDLSDKIIENPFKSGKNIDTDLHGSSHSFSGHIDYDNALTHKSDNDFGHDLVEEVSGVIGGNDLESKLPVVNYFIPLLVSPNSVMDIFNQIWKQQNFQIIEKEEAYSTAVLKEPFSIKKFIFKWVPMFGGEDDEEGSVSAIRMLISVNEVKSCRKVTLKGLYGNNIAIRAFFKFFNRKIQNKLK